MTTFKIGDVVECVDAGENKHITKGNKYTVHSAGQVVGIKSVRVTTDLGNDCHYYASRFALVSTAQERIAARSNDPATSKEAAKAIKPKRVPMRETILDLLDRYTAGLTGQEIAERTGFRLNSVTPRFAELSRTPVGGFTPFIKDSGLRRSGQIVWVLADCKVLA